MDSIDSVQRGKEANDIQKNTNRINEECNTPSKVNHGGSSRGKGSKSAKKANKVNANFLLNFRSHFQEIQNDSQSTPAWVPSNRGEGGTWGKPPTHESRRLTELDSPDSGQTEDVSLLQGGTSPQRSEGRTPPSRERPFLQSESNKWKGGKFSKKSNINANFLLNFRSHAEEMQENPKRAYDSSSRAPAARGGGGSSVRFNRESYMQSRCQYFVRETFDCTGFLYDADAFLGWDNIERVRMHITESDFVCPICLQLPVAAKISKCGHVFCFSCILHYLFVGEKKWRKCPICYETIHENDLRSALCIIVHPFVPQDHMILRLVKRSKEGITTVPRSMWQETYKTRAPHIRDSPPEEFCKIITLSFEEILKFVQQEKSEVVARRLEAESDGEFGELPFLELAEKYITEREKSLIHRVEVEQERFRMKMAEQGEKDSSPAQAVEGMEALAIDGGQRTVPKTREDDIDEFFLFYQCEDGQHIFLSSSDIKLLLREFGDFSCLPEVISADIVNIHQQSFSEETKRRYRYLNHLPVNTPFCFVDLDLREYLTGETLKEYKRERQGGHGKKARNQSHKQQERHGGKGKQNRGGKDKTPHRREKPPLSGNNEFSLSPQETVSQVNISRNFEEREDIPWHK
eukprot:Nk52_evm61s1992 gene=Nk52_evmTU61s1992